jgi:hypothetical protein
MIKLHAFQIIELLSNIAKQMIKNSASYYSMNLSSEFLKSLNTIQGGQFLFLKYQKLINRRVHLGPISCLKAVRKNVAL